MITQKKISLYALSNEYEDLMAQLYNDETGEINEEIEQRLNELAPTSEKKCISVASWIKKMQSERLQLEQYKQEIVEREKAYDKAIDKFNEYLKSNMERQNIKEVSCPYFKLRIRNNPYSTEIYDEDQLPERFVITREIIKTEVRPDKNAIKDEVLKTGIQVPGAYVAQKTKLEIITNKI